MNLTPSITRIAPTYICPTCKACYTTEQDALRCLSSTEPEAFPPGTIVAIRQGYHWFDGDPAWVLGDDKRPGMIEGRGELTFLFVVTSNHPHPYEPHNRVYCVRTLAIENGQRGGQRGWNRTDTHLKMHAVAPELIPDSVREQAKAFVGEVYEYLL